MEHARIAEILRAAQAKLRPTWDQYSCILIANAEGCTLYSRESKAARFYQDLFLHNPVSCAWAHYQTRADGYYFESDAEYDDEFGTYLGERDHRRLQELRFDLLTLAAIIADEGGL